MDYMSNIQKAIDYIEKNLKEKIKVNEVSRIAHFSEFHFQRMFKEAVGDTVMGYIRKRRLTEAAGDLVGSRDRITDIALEYQFGSEEAFSRAFRKAFGMSPKNYRKNSEVVFLQHKVRAAEGKRRIRSGKGQYLCMAA